MPQLDFDGANSKISADKIQGQSGTTVTIPTGHNLAGDGSGLTSLSAANLTGNLPAISGASLTNLPSHSGNVAFPATQVASADANTLDDYEEGTWTPGFLTGTPVYTTPYERTGFYTKIGNRVHADFIIYIGVMSWSDMTLQMEIGSLPFTSATPHPGQGWVGTVATFQLSGCSGSTYNIGGLTAETIVLRLRCNSSQLWIQACDYTSAQYGLRNAAFDVQGCITGNITYTV
jgi:hypothetical protein